MAKMDFQNKTLEKLFRGYKWARNNSIQMLEVAIKNNIVGYKPNNDAFTFQPILHQFQCLASTVDTYYRQLTKSDNEQFGVLVVDGVVTKKESIAQEDLADILTNQLENLETLFKGYSDKDFEENIKAIQSISNHEYLHQGELIVLMREAGVDLPERFKQAFAL